MTKSIFTCYWRDIRIKESKRWVRYFFNYLIFDKILLNRKKKSINSLRTYQAFFIDFPCVQFHSDN